MKNKYLILIGLLITITAFSQPQITLNSFSTGYSSPTDIANCGDSRLFIVQQRGKIFICDSLGVKRTTPFLDITSLVNQTGNERGLLGLTFHPNYKQNGYFYVNYTRSSDGATRVSRFSVNANDSNLAVVSSELNLLTIAQPFSNHNGGNLDFGPDGYLYIGMGDGGSADDPNGNSQNGLSKLGKMLRINVDSGTPYSVPTDNPFVGNSSFNPEIWAYGLRNPWRWSFDKITGDLWIGDVGQNLYEEVDFQLANSTGGQNYGWRCFEGLNHVNTNVTQVGCPAVSSTTPPIFEYSHSTPNGCSITGGEVYRGALYSSLFGYYLVTDYCSGRVWWIQRQANGTFTNGIINSFLTNNYVSFGHDYLGEMYLIAATSGVIYKINAPNPCPEAFITGNDSASYCQGSSTRLIALRGRGLSYQWNLNGVAISGENRYWIDANQPGLYSITVTNSVNCSNTSTDVFVEELTLPIPSITPSGNNILCPGDTLIVVASGGVNYEWGTDANNDTLNVFSAGNYSAVVIAENGCFAQTDTVFVTMSQDPNLLLSGYQQTYVAPVPNDVIVSNLSNTQIFINGVETNSISSSTLVDGNNIISGVFTDANNCVWNFTDTINANFSVNIKNQGIQSFSIIPNPVSKGNSFTINGNFKSISSIQLFDIAGKQIEIKNLNSTQKSFSTAGLNAGIYTIKFYSENVLYTKQLMIIE